MEKFVFRWVLPAVMVCLLSPLSGEAQQRQEIPGFPGDIEAQIKAGQQKPQPDDAAVEQGEAAQQAEARPKVKPKTWEEILEQWLTPIKIHKRKIVPIDEHFAYPHAAVPFKMEIVKEEGEFIWLVGLPPEDPESALHEMWMERQAAEVKLLIKREYDDKFGAGEFLDFSLPLVPPATIRAVDFVKAGKGLPTGGKWQMGFDMADMNGDGFDDLVLPPPRLGKTRHPTIYLSDGKGGFSYWSDAKWNPEVGFDYGDVKVGDFDQDGFLDIVLAVHFKNQYILYGSETHEFRRFKKLPSPDPRITSRATTVADFDGDGRLDVAFLAELDLDMSQSKRVKGTPTIWIVKNTESGWRLDPDYPTELVIGDILRSADMDGDGRQDLILASNTSAWRAIIFFNRVDDRWSTLDERNALGNSFHFGVAPVEAAGNKPPALYAAFEQFMRHEGKQQARTGIVRYDPLQPDWSEISYSTLFYDDQRYNYYFRIAAGDLNGDGIEDLAVSRKKGGIEIWIQTEDGSYYLNTPEELTQAESRAYDLRIVDIDGDGRGDLIAMMADLDNAGPGGIRVWLSKAPS
ncbi:MAG: VCBS repeat-containing protein [Acidobacteriota bacterium]